MNIVKIAYTDFWFEKILTPLIPEDINNVEIWNDIAGRNSF